MPEKRMFSKVVTDTDAFMEMPLSTQALYFHLSLHADDDGFVGNPKRIQKLIGASDDDAKILVAKRYVLAFDSGIIVIKHWRIHNYIQKDRYKETTYVEEKSTLALDSKNAYVEKEKVECIQNVSNLYPECVQNVSNSYPNCTHRLDKISIDKISNSNSSDKKSNKSFIPPTLEEVKAYCKERRNNVDANSFINFYESKGWYVGKNKMVSWKAAVRTWENKDKKDKNVKQTSEWFDEYQENLNNTNNNLVVDEDTSLEELEEFFRK